MSNNSESQVFDSSDSLLNPSEPDDIKKWFSSYKYETPEINTGDGLEGCVSLGRNYSEEEVDFVEDSLKHYLGEFRKENEVIGDDDEVDSLGYFEDNDANQVTDSCGSLSFSSEPPDIKNWFSSYVYESPALDSSYEFQFHNCKENNQGRLGSNSGTITTRQHDFEELKNIGKSDDLVGQKTPSSGVARFNISLEDKNLDHHNQGKHDVKGKENASIVTKLPVNKPCEHILESKRAKLSSDDSIKDIEISSLYDDDSPRGSNNKFALGSHEPVGVMRTSDKNVNSLTKLAMHSGNSKAESNSDGKLSLNSNWDFNARNISSPKGTYIMSKHGKNAMADGGFVSARKNRNQRENDENSLNRPLGVHFESSRNGRKISLAGNKVGNLRRKALSETTNAQTSDAGITGKWRCPQKGKPNLGPPMKQLRLERWVHRV